MKTLLAITIAAIATASCVASIEDDTAEEDTSTVEQASSVCDTSPGLYCPAAPGGAYGLDCARPKCNRDNHCWECPLVQ